MAAASFRAFVDLLGVGVPCSSPLVDCRKKVVWRETYQNHWAALLDQVCCTIDEHGDRLADRLVAIAVSNNRIDLALTD